MILSCSSSGHQPARRDPEPPAVSAPWCLAGWGQGLLERWGVGEHGSPWAKVEG